MKKIKGGYTKKKYVYAGDKKLGEYLEGFLIGPGHYNCYDLESKCNSLAIKITQAPMEQPARSDRPEREKREPARYPAPNVTNAKQRLERARSIARSLELLKSPKEQAVSAARRTMEPEGLSPLTTNLVFTIIDFFGGESLREAQAQIYSAPIPGDEIANDDLWNRWVSNPKNDKLLYRLLKFKARGYTIDDRTARTIYNYWVEHPEDGNRDWDAMWKVLDENQSHAIMNMFREHLEELSAKGLSVPRFESFLKIFTSKGLLGGGGGGSSGGNGNGNGSRPRNGNGSRPRNGNGSRPRSGNGSRPRSGSRPRPTPAVNLSRLGGGP